MRLVEEVVVQLHRERETGPALPPANVVRGALHVGLESLLAHHARGGVGTREQHVEIGRVPQIRAIGERGEHLGIRASREVAALQRDRRQTGALERVENRGALDPRPRRSRFRGRSASGELDGNVEVVRAERSREQEVHVRLARERDGARMNLRGRGPPLGAAGRAQHRPDDQPSGVEAEAHVEDATAAERLPTLDRSV